MTSFISSKYFFLLRVTVNLVWMAVTHPEQDTSPSQGPMHAFIQTQGELACFSEVAEAKSSYDIQFCSTYPFNIYIYNIKMDKWNKINECSAKLIHVCGELGME